MNTPDVAAIASRSALDGSAKRTRLSLGRDGIMQYVDLDRGNRAEDAQVVGLRTLYGAVKTDRERSRIRRELLRQCIHVHTRKTASCGNKTAENPADSVMAKRAGRLSPALAFLRQARTVGRAGLSAAESKQLLRDRITALIRANELRKAPSDRLSSSLSGLLRSVGRVGSPTDSVRASLRSKGYDFMGMPVSGNSAWLYGLPDTATYGDILRAKAVGVKARAIGLPRKTYASWGGRVSSPYDDKVLHNGEFDTRLPSEKGIMPSSEWWQ